MNKPLRKNDIQVLSDIEHVLKRPGMYCGSVNEEIYATYLYENNKIVQKDIPQIPAIIKLFDEIISNSLDEAIRTKFKYATKIKVDFNPDSGFVTIEDNGRGLPIEYDETLKKWTPEIIYTHLKAGSNFNDDEKEMLVGQYGVGGSLVPIFSKKFLIETANGHKKYKQTLENHLAIKRKPDITDSKDNYTCISYFPNYDYFKVSEEVKENLIVLYEKRVRDLAFAYPEVTFWFNKEKIAVPKLKQFVEQIHEVYEANEVENGRIAIFYSDTEFQQMSFVNGAYTSRGGTHVDYAINKIIEYLRVFLKKKHKLDVKPIDIRSKIFLLLSIRMNNPAFDSQTKERLMSVNNFKDLIDSLLTEKFLSTISKNEEIILPIVEAYKLKLQVKENVDLKKLSQKKKARVEKYFPATKWKKYLVLTEGDSAMNGLMSILGRETFSYFPLKGKPLNVLEAKIDKIKANDEIKNIVNILNLRLDKDDQSELNYENILYATDQDLDGMAIRGLLNAFFYKFGSSLLKQNRIKFLRTPIIAGFDKKGKIVEYYFTLNDYNKNKKSNGIKYNYYKGLATWDAADLSDLIKTHGINHFIQDFVFDDEAEATILNWMHSSNVDYRKEQMRDVQFNINSI